MTTLTELTAEDKKKISRCDDYKLYKRLTLARQEYGEFEVGTAVFIKRKSDGELLCRGGYYNSIKYPPTKFLIVENDDGFVFAKRILATGQPGKDIVCLTSDYGPEFYQLVPDEAMVDAMLLDQDYDPTSQAKDLKKKKNKATRTNNQYRIQFPTPQEAYAYLETLKPGDKIWSAETTFGSAIAEFEVISSKKDEVKDVSKDRYLYGGDRKHKYHQDEGFDKLLEVHIKLVSGGTRWTNTDQILYFMNFCTEKEYKYYGEMYFSRKPITAEDVV